MTNHGAGTSLRQLLAAPGLVYLPAVYDPLGARVVQAAGAQAAYVGGYVTGASRAVTEPLLTMTEQIATAEAVARSTELPVLCDAGAGFGEPLHVTRTVREFIAAGIAGIHIEDQLYPKRAHYHRNVAHTVALDEFAQKIRWAAVERDKQDPSFVLIARSDACREEGLDAALERVNRGAAEGADLGLLFPRSVEEAKRAPREAAVPLVYVQSRGNRDGRPVLSMRTLEDMGYAACIDAQLFLLAAVAAAGKAVGEVIETGSCASLSQDQAVTLRQSVEDLIGLEEYYAIEADTVEGGD